jgi:hypothetical protein
VSNIELTLLGSIFYLTADASHYTISTITNISEEVHRRFFKWIADMNSIKHEYIYMPRNDDNNMWWESTQPGVSPVVLEAWTVCILRGIDAPP